MKITIRVAPQIFELAPTYRRGVVLATGLDNKRSDPVLEEMLAAIVVAKRTDPVDLAAMPLIVEWDAAHRASGTNPNRFLPSHKALLKRVQRPAGGVPFVNNVVACMNITSLKHILPVGSDDLEQVASLGKCLELRVARGDERFFPLGEPDSVESPSAGEVIYVVGGEIMCRRWNWRNSDTTRVTERTTSIVMNVDAIGVDSGGRAVAAADEAAELLRSRCGATVSVALLSPDNIEFSVCL